VLPFRSLGGWRKRSNGPEAGKPRPGCSHAAIHITLFATAPMTLFSATRSSQLWNSLIVWLAGPIVPISMSIAGLVIARSVNPAVYGRVAYFFSSLSLIIILWQLGLGPQTTREVAWSLGKGGLTAAASVIPPYVIARILSVAFLIPVALFAVLQGDLVLATATAAGAIALLRDFAQALVQGIGRAPLVAGIQIGQGLLYLLTITLWAKDDPQRVFTAVIVTYALSLLIGLWACRPLLPNVTLWWGLSRGRWGAVGRSLGWLYAIALLQTPFTSLAVLALGRAGRFEDAAAFSIALTIPLLLSVSSATIIAVQYFPRLSHLLGQSGANTREHFGRLYRVLVWVCISAAAILLVQARAVITLLFTAAYGSAVEPLMSLAPAAATVPLGQFALWTLIAHDLRGWALAGAAALLAAVLPFIAIAISVPQAPLWVLGIGHTVAATAALSIWVFGLHQGATTYHWRPARVGIASLAAFLTAAAMGFVTLDGPWAGLTLLIITGCAVSVVTGLIIWSGEVGSFFWPIRQALANRTNKS
jgi:O-antigen/teichoic acid export membrane protein